MGLNVVRGEIEATLAPLALVYARSPLFAMLALGYANFRHAFRRFALSGFGLQRQRALLASAIYSLASRRRTPMIECKKPPSACILGYIENGLMRVWISLSQTAMAKV